MTRSRWLLIAVTFLAGILRERARQENQILQIKSSKSVEMIRGYTMLLNVNVGQIPPEQVERSMQLFGEKVLPLFRA